MNQLVAKEVRGITPAFLTALALAIVPVWLLPGDTRVSDTGMIASNLMYFGMLVMALSVFGREFGMGTFPVLLALPIERSRIWWVKVGVAACGLVIVFAAGIISMALWGHQLWIEEGGVMSLVLLYAVILSSGLWTTLLLRQMVAAFWFAVLIPASIVIFLFRAGWTPAAQATLWAYSATGFISAWVQFNRAQEVGWTGGEVSLPDWQIDDASSRPANRKFQPMKAMIWKEAQIYQVALAGMAALFVVHLVVVIVRKALHAGDQSSIVASLLDMFGGIWLIVPFFTGGLNVAEERRLGTMEAQLCLPFSTQRQFWTKLVATVALSGILCAVLLWAAEGFATAIGTFGGLGGMKISLYGEGLPSLLVAFTMLSLLTFYASTLSRNILQTLAVAVVTAAALAMIWAFAVAIRRNVVLWLWEPSILSLISWPIAGGVMVWLGYTNYRRLSQTGRLWGRNISMIALAMLGSGLLTTLIFNRAWEYLTPADQAHGQRVFQISQAPVLHTDATAVSALLPDGRIWWDTLFYVPPRWTVPLGKGFVLSLDEGKLAGSQGNHFLEGTNWAVETCAARQTVGIQTDGSLWASVRVMRGGQVKRGRPVPQPVDNMTRPGNESDWKDVVQGGYGAILLKTDGTLWTWADNSLKYKRGMRLAQLTPEKLGADSDWTDITAWPNGTLVWKNDGQAWVISSQPQTGHKNETVGDTGLYVERMEMFDGFRWKSCAQSFVFYLTVRDDGTLWTFGPPAQYTGSIPYSFPKKPTQIGTANDWVAVMGNFRMLVALKRDGTLWKWDTAIWSWNDWIPLHAPTRLGTQNDWVAISGEHGGSQTLAAMAADGSIWLWSKGFVMEEWLRPSRKPELFANVLQEK